MKFEEQEITIELPNYQNSFIYFLVNNNEVVYVGQTTMGILRPLSHKDKIYDTIYIMYCNIENLDELEDKYIMKYKPKYNKKNNDLMRYSLQRVKRLIKTYFDFGDFDIYKLRKILRDLDIKPEFSCHQEVISLEEFNKIMEYIKRNF